MYEWQIYQSICINLSFSTLTHNETFPRKGDGGVNGERMRMIKQWVSMESTCAGEGPLC